MDLAPLYNPDAPKHARLVCCDWLEEHGDDEQRPTAMAWRWIINEGKRPVLNSAKDYAWLDGKRSIIPPEIIAASKPIRVAIGFGTERQAFDRAVAALVQAEREGKAPWQTASEKYM